MRTLWLALMVVAFALTAHAQTSTGGGSAPGNGGKPAVSERLDMSFGFDDKEDLGTGQPPEKEPGKEVPPDPPELYGEEFPVETAAIVIIIDCSCSMLSSWQTFIGPDGEPKQGYRMDRAKAECQTAINGLSENFVFDVVEFVCGQSACFGSLQPATAANKGAANGWVGALQARDATGTGPAVAWALGNPAYSDCFTYILLTDGAPNCLDSGYGWADWPAHLNMINAANGKGATIHVVAISPYYGSMETFCQQVAAQNGPGTYKVVN